MKQVEAIRMQQRRLGASRYCKRELVQHHRYHRHTLVPLWTPPKAIMHFIWRQRACYGQARPTPGRMAAGKCRPQCHLRPNEDLLLSYTLGSYRILLKHEEVSCEGEEVTNNIPASTCTLSRDICPADIAAATKYRPHCENATLDTIWYVRHIEDCFFNPVSVGFSIDGVQLAFEAPTDASNHRLIRSVPVSGRNKLPLQHEALLIAPSHFPHVHPFAPALAYQHSSPFISATTVNDGYEMINILAYRTFSAKANMYIFTSQNINAISSFLIVCHIDRLGVGLIVFRDITGSWTSGGAKMILRVDFAEITMDRNFALLLVSLISDTYVY
ncbi:hypothetical protein HW555_013953 [Spodoptera exigua]|uniref:Uncharacterized protein n=1 Tax=Spodoptera exigua TaxID=7107 RepID=A0A835KZB6_SPOEX|nr:hypothetical protein HW555_013953 [Spodoptera exigua]